VFLRRPEPAAQRPEGLAGVSSVVSRALTMLHGSHV